MFKTFWPHLSQFGPFVRSFLPPVCVTGNEGIDANLARQVGLINFRFKQLKMASRKTMPLILVYFNTINI